MANPFLVLGGVAVGIVTAGIGALQVPGWIDSANDSAAINDLGDIALAQQAAYTVEANYVGETRLASGQLPGGGESGVQIQPSVGVDTAVFVNPAADRWVAISKSKSGKLVIRTSDSSEIFKSTSKNFAEAVGQLSGKLGGVTVSLAGATTVSGLNVAGFTVAP